ncbi:MAG: haloalkane dehalogenase [Candidatus Marinamargulisbacteria bacterium]|jgi:haloalkane dehalogenase
MTKKNISAEFPFESKYVQVNGSRMHYIDEGEGDPILFLHGNPTSNYLWRNIIPYLSSSNRCIAPDLIGMGKSDKIDSNYHFSDHYAYIESFVKTLGLSKVTLVIHDWGSALGFNYWAKNEKNVKGIAFMEALIKPMEWSELPPDFRMTFRLLRTPGIGWLMASVMNMFVKGMLRQTIKRALTKEEKEIYAAPFPTIKSRKPVRQWPVEIPISGTPKATFDVISGYSQKLQESDISKLLFYATPGAIIDKKGLDWCKSNIKNLETVDIGEGIHFIQEDNPHLIGEKLAEWVKTL